MRAAVTFSVCSPHELQLHACIHQAICAPARLHTRSHMNVDGWLWALTWLNFGRKLLMRTASVAPIAAITAKVGSAAKSGSPS